MQELVAEYAQVRTRAERVEALRADTLAALTRSAITSGESPAHATLFTTLLSQMVFSMEALSQMQCACAERGIPLPPTRGLVVMGMLGTRAALLRLLRPTADRLEFGDTLEGIKEACCAVDADFSGDAYEDVAGANAVSDAAAHKLLDAGYEIPCIADPRTPARARAWLCLASIIDRVHAYRNHLVQLTTGARTNMKLCECGRDDCDVTAWDLAQNMLDIDRGCWERYREEKQRQGLVADMRDFAARRGFQLDGIVHDVMFAALIEARNVAHGLHSGPVDTRGLAKDPQTAFFMKLIASRVKETPSNEESSNETAAEAPAAVLGLTDGAAAGAGTVGAGTGTSGAAGAAANNAVAGAADGAAVATPGAAGDAVAAMPATGVADGVKIEMKNNETKTEDESL